MTRIAGTAVTALILVGVLCGCMIAAPVIPPQGWVYNDTKAPISTNFKDTPVGTKVGTASASSLLWGLMGFGDCSIHAAAKQGGLSKIYHADYEHFNILGVYTKTTVFVYGE